MFKVQKSVRVGEKSPNPPTGQIFSRLLRHFRDSERGQNLREIFKEQLAGVSSVFFGCRGLQHSTGVFS